MARSNQDISGSRCLILGLSFKENCPDVRNTGVSRIIEAMSSYGIKPVVCDPWVDQNQAEEYFNVEMVDLSKLNEIDFDTAILAVAHEQFLGMGADLREKLGKGILVDVKSVLPREFVDVRI